MGLCEISTAQTQYPIEQDYFVEFNEVSKELSSGITEVLEVIKTSSGDDIDYGYAVVGGLETVKSTLSPLIFMLKLEIVHGRENQYNADALNLILRYSKVILQYIEKDRPSVISMLEHDNYQTYSEYLNKQIGYYDRMYSLFENTIEDISFWIQELENREIKEL